MCVSYDALVDLFVFFEDLLSRLSIYAGIPLTPALTNVLVKIIAELISTLALVTKQVKQGRFSVFVFARFNGLLNGIQRKLWGSFRERRKLKRQPRGWIG